MFFEKSRLVIKFFICSVIIVNMQTGFAQQLRYDKPNAGIQAGLVTNFGTHEFSFGIQVKGFIGFDYAQLNVGNTFSWKFYSYANRKLFYENRFYAGAVLMAGKNNANLDFELSGLNHQTKRSVGLGFNYLIYTDNAGTSQLSGAWALHIKNVSIYFENDMFGGQTKDRFRSGILIASYKANWYKLYAGLYIWTGEAAGSFWDKTPSYKMPSGYRSLEDLPYGKTSHGILYGGVKFLMPFGGNFTRLEVGVDSEHISTCNTKSFYSRLTLFT